MSNPLISVIIPVYKVESYLIPCVNSIRSQTYSNLEILLIDDGSPDNCPAICENLRASDSRIVVFHKPNGGLASARNFGLQRASGSYILYVDSDDTIDPNMISHLFSLIQLHQADIACSSYQTTRDFAHKTVRLSGSIHTDSAVDMLKIIYRYGLWQSWGKLIRTSLAKSTPFTENLLYEDYENTPKLFLQSKKVVLSMDGYYHYTCRSDSIMSTHATCPSPDYLSICYQNIALFQQFISNPADLHALTWLTISHVLHQHRSCLLQAPTPEILSFLRQSERFISSQSSNISSDFNLPLYKKLLCHMICCHSSFYRTIIRQFPVHCL